MKALAFKILFIFVVLQIHAQGQSISQQKFVEQAHCAEYKRVVGKILKDDELFVMFYMDAALVVDPNADTQIVKQIKTENPWESLKEYLYDKSDIYFCPSGSQLNIAIEYMPCPLDNGSTMSSQYGMYRLSSPEELFKNRGEPFRSTKHKAVVYGGLDYDAESKNKEPLLAFNRNRGSDGYGELKNAEAEAQYIDSLLRRQNIEVALMSGVNGSEKSFYKIPYTKADILHIASHGEYQPDEDNLESKSLEEWMMSHSALILSGYNTPSSHSNDDGRLTAYEISQTDLSNIKLAVLSVCESAKGDIKENEVYGLLKGFKMAGAGTLLLTLDTVNDEITKMLMIRFYENLFRGNDPRNALESAQRFLMRYLVRYDNGKYKDSEEWKKFFLVDDLDRNIGQNVTDEERKYFLDEIVGLRDIYSTNQLFPNWDKVRARLTDNDKVIRFFTYSIFGDMNHSMPYVALIGEARTGNIIIKRLFTVSDKNLSQFTFERQSLDETLKLYDNVIWKPLLPVIKGSTRIYFQPVGVVGNVPIECLKSVIDRYELFRISSFDVLMSRKNYEAKSGREIALFGGLYFDCKNELDYNTSKISLTRGVEDLFLTYLPGTKMEVNIIDSIARLTRRNSFMYSECSGTERAFRKLVSQNMIDAVHFSTHATQGSTLTASPTSISQYLYGHSALFLSGVNHIQVGHMIKEDEDGMLTGAEISEMNLNNITFVALSGCNTGRGLAKNTYAIYDNSWSLANSFKKAGVRTILCSLWNVEDECTSILMIKFYTNWFGKNIPPRQALEEARKTMRETKGWENPNYWASFILLDGLD